jgi:hypothetical protein
MQDFVSTRVVRVVGLAALMSMVWTVFVPHEISWRTLGGVSLAFLGALLLRKQCARSIQAVGDRTARGSDP